MTKTRFLLICAALSASLVLPAVATAATTYYVGPALNTTGSCDASHECTIDYALSKANTSGDTVYVEHGTYVHASSRFDSGTMTTVNNSGVFVEDGVNLVGAPGLPRPIIVQNDPYTHPTGCNCGVIAALGAATVTHVRIVQHDAAAGGALGMQGSAKVDDSELIGDGVGVETSAGTGGHVRSSLVVGGTVGLEVSSPLTIQQSTVIAHTGNAVSAFTPSGTTTVTLQNSIARSENSIYDLYAYGGSGSLTINTDHSATRLASAQLGAGGHVADLGGNVTANPLFVNAAASNYREAAGSPTIDAGLGPVSALDLDGNPFTGAGRPDIGAYEYYAPPPPPVNPPASPPAPKVLGDLKLTLGSKLDDGKASVKISCPKAAVGTCSGSIAIKQGHKTRTSKFSKVKPGKTKTLKIKAKKGKAQIKLTETDGAGATGSVSLSKKLK